MDSEIANIKKQVFDFKNLIGEDFSQINIQLETNIKELKDNYNIKSLEEKASSLKGELEILNKEIFLDNEGVSKTKFNLKDELKMRNSFSDSTLLQKLKLIATKIATRKFLNNSYRNPKINLKIKEYNITKEKMEKINSELSGDLYISLSDNLANKITYISNIQKLKDEIKIYFSIVEKSDAISNDIDKLDNQLKNLDASHTSNLPTELHADKLHNRL